MKKYLFGNLILLFLIQSFIIYGIEKKVENNKIKFGNVKMSVKEIVIGNKKAIKTNKPQKISKKHFDKYEYDNAKRLVKIISKDKGIIKRTFDAYGRLESINNSNLEYVKYYYDILNRMIKIVYKNKEEKDFVKFKYSTPVKSYKPGVLIEKTEKNEKCFYKYLGNKLSEETKIIDNKRFRIKYTYNKKGYLSELEYPSGLKVIYKYDSKSEIKEIITKTNNNENSFVIYKKDKEKSVIDFGNGLSTVITTNKDKREVIYKTGDFQYFRARVNEKGLISHIFDKKNIGNRKEFYYDKNERLVTTFGPFGKISYRYDDMDNLKIKREDRSRKHSGKKVDKPIINTKLYYNNKSSKTKIMKVNKKDIIIEYDKLGRMTKYKNWVYKYNIRGRLSKIYKNNKLITELFYNNKNQRVIEKNGSSIYYYIFDNKDNIIAKYQKSNNKLILLKEYIYNGNMQVGFISNGEKYYYHFDILNYPVEITNNKGNLVRSTQYKPYGEMLTVKNSIKKEEYQIKDNLRFPGQFQIENTNLFYNLNRTYNNEIGRYLEPDPLLQNTENHYQYAGSNPIKYFDLIGLRLNTYTGRLVSVEASFKTFFFLNFKGIGYSGSMESDCFDENGKSVKIIGEVKVLLGGFSIGKLLLLRKLPFNIGAMFGNISKMSSLYSYKFNKPTIDEFDGTASFIGIKGNAKFAETSIANITFGNCYTMKPFSYGFGATNTPEIESMFLAGWSWGTNEKKRCCY